MISIHPVEGLPEIREGDDLAALVGERIELADADVVVVAQKAVSKAEGRVIRIDSLEASPKAIELAGDERDPREVEAVLREATRIVRERVGNLAGAEVGVIVSDSFGRAWRQGTTDVAIGLAGIRALLDLTGERDAAGYELHATVIAVADELAAAAQLAMGKTSGIPAAVIRGYDASGEGSARDLVMPAERDLFR